MTPPTSDPVTDGLSTLVSRHRHVDEGAVADYIPELAHADPSRFGIALASVHGRVYAAGDAEVEFTIQSISKAFVYALAITDVGLDEVARHVGFEPSGEPFNAISLEPETGRPANPLINAGAIVASSLVTGAGPDDRFARILRMLSACAGRELAVDDAVFASEMATGDRNRALAHLARSTGVLPRAVDDAVEVYFRQCAVLASASDLAMMAATLANGGANPRTGEEVVDEQVAMTVLSVMATCGMYDDSGEWMVRVGLPAKSGVGGGIVAVQPGQFGIGVFSPRLDPQGNSVRGVAALRALSEEYGLHMLAHPLAPRSPVSASRPIPGGHEVVLRGELDFLAAEEVADHLAALGRTSEEGGRTIRVDVSGVTLVRPAARAALASAAEQLARLGVDVDVADPRGVGLVSPPDRPG